MAAGASFVWVGGADVFADFGRFSKAYLAAGVTTAVLTYFQRKSIEEKLAYEENKITQTLGRKGTAYGQEWAGKSLKDWCAVKQTGPGLFLQNMICALDLSSFGINK